jgi:acyl carrier protein
MQDQRAVLEVIARHVQRDPGTLSGSDVLTDIGVDSLKFIVMVLEIEQLINRKIFDMENIGELNTVGDVLALVKPPAGVDNT